MTDTTATSLTFMHFEFDDIELTLPTGAGADTVILDGNPGSEPYRFNPRGIVVNATKLRSVRLLTAADLDEIGIPTDTLFHRRTKKAAAKEA